MKYAIIDELTGKTYLTINSNNQKNALIKFSKQLYFVGFYQLTKRNNKYIFYDCYTKSYIYAQPIK